MAFDHDLWHEVQAFYYREAWLLDDRRFEEWLTLFTSDTFYFMPQRTNRPPADQDREITGLGELALLEDDFESLRIRVAQLATGKAWAEVPPSRTRRLVTNIVVEPAEHAGEYRVRNAFLTSRSRLERDEDFFIGSRDDTLRRVKGELKIARRTIVLDVAVLTAKNLSIFF